ncbi:uncharacterized protein rab44 isoform X2 [Centroberyx affinis]|uniref:uncharacterized protein rab44 isoform X2 n=1 Tax=Centroberyx affinis TaxID=166261 RepID=UPI003A5BB892
MSGQRARKTRIGSSRRRVSNQNEKSEADDGFHKTDSPSAVQDHMTEEITESGSKHLASSELTGNRRKLGSSRRIKGRQHVKDSIAESCHEARAEAREEVGEKATSNEALFNQSSKLLPGTIEMESASYQSQDFVEPDLSHIRFRHSENQGEETNPENKCNEDRSTENMKRKEKNESFKEESRELSENSIARRREVMLDEQTIQDEPGEMSILASEEMKQEELSQGSEHDIMSHDSSICSSTIPDDSFEFQNPTATNCPEAFLESLIPKSENVVEDGHERADDNKLEVADFCKSSEIMLEGMDIFHTFQSEEVSDHVKSNSQLVGMSEMSSFILDSVPPIDHQMTDQSNSREMPDELPSLVLDSAPPIDHQMTDQSNSREMPDELPSVHSVMDKENKERDEAMELLRQSGNLQANYLVSETRTKVEDTESPNKPVIITEKSRPVEPTDLECINEAGDGFHKTDSPSAVQDHMTEENTESGSKHLASSELTGNRRKFGSSRRTKGRQHVKDRIAESCHEAREELLEKATSNEALFNQSSKLLPGTIEMESASYQSQDFVEPDLSHIQFRHSENQGEETNPENKCNEDRSTENMKMLTEKNESFREESRELSENSIARQREVMLDEQTIQDEPGEMSILASEEMKQEELSQGSEHDIMSHDSSICSSTIPDDSFEFQNPTATNCPEAFLESLIPKSENVVEDGHERADDNKLEVADFCKSSEIMLEGMDLFHTFQSEEVSDHVKSNAHLVGMSEMSSFILDSESNSREMPDELPSVHSVMDKENKERDEAMELLRQSGNLQANYLVSETRTKVEDTESPNKPVIITEKSRPVEPTDLELTTEELPTDERHNFKLSHLDANPFTQLHQSEDAVNNKVHEQEVKPAQIKEMHPIQIHDAARNLESPFGNLTDVNVEIGDPYQSELIVKSVDDSANEQEVSNPDNKLDGHPTKLSNSEILNQRHEDDYVYDSGEPRINTTERADTAPGPVYVYKGQVGDDMKAIAEDIVHQGGERLPCETEDNESSLQTLHSDSGLCAGEHTHISNSTGRRRKMASTRRTFRDKLKQHKDNDSHEDVDMEKIEMPIDFKAECSNQSNETSCTNMEPLPERVALTLIKSTSYEKTSHNIDSPLVETHHLDDMTDPNLSISGWQPYSSSEEAQSQSRERDDPLVSPPQDNSVSLREQTNTENMEEDTLLSQIQTNSKTMTTEISSSSETHGLVKSTEKVSEKEEEKKLIEELESGSEFTGYEEFKIMESRTSTLDELNQVETFQDQAMEVIYCDKEATRQEFHMKETNDIIETVEDFTEKDIIEIGEKYDTEAEGSMGIQVVSEKDEVGEQFGDPAKEDHSAQEINTSREISYSELLSAAQNKNVLSDTLAAFDICHEEDLRKVFPEPVVHVSEESDADATDVHQSQQGILDRPSQHKDIDAISQIKSTGKRRKMGSTRRMKHGRKQEGGTDNRDEIKEGNLNIEVESFEAEFKTIVEAKCNTSDLHVVEIDKGASDMTHADISTQSINQKEDINMGIQMGSNRQLDPFENTANEDVGGLFLADCKSAVIQITDNEEMIDNEPKTTEGRTIDSIPRSLHGEKDEVTEEALKETKEIVVKLSVMETEEVSQTENTETSLNTMYKPNDMIKEEQQHQETIETITGEIQDQDIKKDEVSKPEEASSVNEVDFEIVKSEDSGGTGEGDENAQTTIQEPKMSEEAHNIKIEMKNESEVSNPANRRRKMGSTRRNLRPKGEELHRKQEADNEVSEIAKNVGDAVMTESESSIKTLQLQIEHKDGDSEKEREKIFETMKECSHQSVLGTEENTETERHLTPSCLPSKSATFPEHDLLSESKSGGKRRKMGSNRKSRGHQHHKVPTECEDKITDAGDGRDLKSKTEESAIGTLEEVVTSYDKSGNKPSSSSSISSTGDPSRPVDVLSQRASEQETPNQLPGPEDHLVQAREKTHSLGIDTCMQSVRVDGKTVVLQLWDTAGQERFHSITRQVFHKAQAFILMYDVTSFQSFSDVRYWVSCIQEGAVENVIIILLGNKSDCAEQQVHSHQGEVLAKEYNIDFMECSAATGENVMQSLETVARMLCQTSDTKEEGMVLHKEPQQRKKSGCC